jgi:hypothetical protein
VVGIFVRTRYASNIRLVNCADRLQFSPVVSSSASKTRMPSKNSRASSIVSLLCPTESTIGLMTVVHHSPSLFSPRIAGLSSLRTWTNAPSLSGEVLLDRLRIRINSSCSRWESWSSMFCWRSRKASIVCWSSSGKGMVGAASFANADCTAFTVSFSDLLRGVLVLKVLR